KRGAKVVKGGKRVSFNALVVVGDRKGRVGWGYGKANEVPFAVNKGIQEGKKSLIEVPVVKTTIPHEIREKHGATSVILRPACEDRKSTRLNSSHEWISYAVFCLKKKKTPG